MILMYFLVDWTWVLFLSTSSDVGDWNSEELFSTSVFPQVLRSLYGINTVLSRYAKRACNKKDDKPNANLFIT